MNYEYLLTIDSIDEKIIDVIEYEKGKINGKKWTINEIKSDKIKEDANSFKRTKQWLLENYPELLI
jgi:hypothetical protein